MSNPLIEIEGTNPVGSPDITEPAAFGTAAVSEGNKYDILFTKMENLQREQEKNKANYVELLGLFAGIVAFVLGTLHFTTSQVPFSQALVTIVALGITLAIFVALIDRITVRRLPKLEFYIFVLIGTIVLSGLVWFSFAYEKNWEQFVSNTASSTNANLQK